MDSSRINEDTPSNRMNRNFIIKKRPNSQKVFREQNNINIEDELNKEIEELVQSNKNNVLRSSKQTFNQAGKMLLGSNKNAYEEMNKKQLQNYENATEANISNEIDLNRNKKMEAIRLNSGFPTINDEDSKVEEIDKMMINEEKKRNGSSYNVSKENSMYSNMNITEINKKNDDRLNKYDNLWKGNDFLLKNNFNNDRLNIIKEEGELEKLDQLIKLYDK